MKVSELRQIIENIVTDEVKKTIISESEVGNKEVYHIKCEGVPLGTYQSQEDAENDMEKFKKWIPLSDFYDEGWMPHIQYFNNWMELKNTLNTISNDRLKEISNAMKNHNVIRQEKIKQLWNSTLKRIK